MEKAGCNICYDFKGISETEWQKAHQNVNRVYIWIVGDFYILHYLSLFPAINSITYVTYNKNYKKQNYF